MSCPALDVLGAANDEGTMMRLLFLDALRVTQGRSEWPEIDATKCRVTSRLGLLNKWRFVVLMVFLSGGLTVSTNIGMGR